MRRLAPFVGIALATCTHAHPESAAPQPTSSSPMQPTAPASGIMPLDVGRRWTYVHDGREGLILDVVEPRSSDGVRYDRIRVRGPSLFWHDEQLLVSSDATSLRIIGGIYEDHVIMSEPPYDAFRTTSRVGETWMDHSAFIAHSTQVMATEAVSVPAGRYTASRIRYVRTSHLGEERDFDIWFAPGVGIVRVEFWQSSNQRGTTPISPPERYDLSRVEVVPTPRLSSGTSLPPHPIAVTGRVASAHAVVGEPVELEFRVENHTSEPLALLPSLDDSDVGARAPALTLELRDGHGPVSVSQPARCGYVNELRVRDFVAVASGGSLDVFGPGSFGHWMLREWRPAHPGRYTARLIYDLGDPSQWGAPIVEPELRRLVNALPAGRFESAPVVIDVEAASSRASADRGARRFAR